MRKHYTDKQRSDLVALATSGRTTILEAAAQLGVRPSTAYYWMRGAPSTTPSRIRPAGPERVATPTFVRVVPSGAPESALAVRVGGAEIRVRRGFDPELLRNVVEALRGGVA